MEIKREIYSERNIKSPLIWGIISAFLFFVSLKVDYQEELIKEHTRFRKGFPSRSSWENPPDGFLSCYIFNVTNHEAFLNGTNKKLHFQQIGPIVYRIKSRHRNLTENEEDSTLTFRKIRYETMTFDAERSPPGILDQKIYVANGVLLSLASRVHDWFLPIRNAFNVLIGSESVFLHRTIHEFLWNYTTPLMDKAKKLGMPLATQNAGMLHNAMREKKEFFTVNIGYKNGLENFFKIRSLNNYSVFSEHFSRGHTDPNTCPIHVQNSFENTLFPPYLTRKDRLSIVTGDSCRIHPLVYDSDVNEFGHKGFKFVIPSDNSSICLNNSKGIPLPQGIFDVSNCVYDVPTAYSQPHFFGTSYNYSEHFEGLSPNAKEHQAHILIEPTTGIPFDEKIRFMTMTPVPELSGFKESIQKFNKMMVPTFWYEYDLDDLPTHAQIMLKITAVYSPYIQKVCIALFLLGALIGFTKVVCRIYGISLSFGKREVTITETPSRYYHESDNFLSKKPNMT